MQNFSLFVVMDITPSTILQEIQYSSKSA